MGWSPEVWRDEGVVLDFGQKTTVLKKRNVSGKLPKAPKIRRSKF